MKKQTILLTLYLTLSPLQLSAKDMEGGYAVFGVGATNCQAYLQARRKGGLSAKEYREWTLAYASAFNLLIPNTYNILGKRGYRDLRRWLDDHCRSNRNQLFIDAVATLTTALYDNRLNINPKSDNKAKWDSKVMTK